MSAALKATPLEVVAEKLVIAKQHKETGDVAFKEGKTKDALRSYHSSLLYLAGIDKNSTDGLGINAPPPVGQPPAQTPTEIDIMLEKVYANMSACHLKEKNWKRTLETADKALFKNGQNYKAMFRKGKALGELGFFEKAVKVLEDLKKNNPTDAAVADAEISRLKAIDRERDRKSKEKMKGFLSGKSLSVDKNDDDDSS
ncbi:hypothetical protein ONZ45_g13023 [Pleurotus djamor]|nr:hypothetical protein ONZ45_g13023 [Pleurotus djamor]